MKADYDSQADALSIDLRQFKAYDHQETVEDTYCHVGIVDGEAADVELLVSADHLDLLAVVAERYGFDAEELLATAQAALAAPDHLVEVSVGESLVA